MASARFTILTPACVRIEYAIDDRFVDEPTLLACSGSGGARPTPMAEPVVVFDDPQSEAARSGGIVLATDRFELRYRPHGRGVDRESLMIELKAASGAARWYPGDRQTSNLGGTLATLDGVRSAVNLNEGLLSLDGWYLIDDSQGHLLRDGWVVPRSTSPGAIDWYFFAYGRDYRAALASLMSISGPVPVPRRCVLGSWYSRYWPHTSAEFRALVEDYESHGIPLDVMVLDMDWHRAGWTGWSWNRELLPDAEDLLRWLRARGLSVTLNLHPADGVGPHEDRYADFMWAIGRDPASGQTVPFDAGDRMQMNALFDRVLRPLEEIEGGGVDFWWVDWQQDRFVRSVPGLTNLQWLNRLFFEHTRSRGRRGVSFSRWAGEAGTSAPQRWGDHRHPIHFSGDAHTGWDMLAFQVPFTVTAGNVGCFFWSHDIGGHFGPRIEEATARWVQFGALSAALRLHSARMGVLDRRPWTYHPRFFEAMRAAFALRAELMPYLYTQVRRSCREGVPLLRPMYLDHADEPRAYEAPGQYMLGDDLIAAPIVTPGEGERCVATQVVWFPPTAAAWRRWSTGERFVGGAEAIVAATIDETPLFVREGVPMALQTVRPRMTDGVGGRLIVRVWPRLGSNSEATLSTQLEEDDGLTEDPDDRLVARTEITATWGRMEGGGHTLQLNIGALNGRYAGMPDRRSVELQIGGVAELHRVSDGQGGHVAGVEHDRHRLGGCVRIPLPELSVRMERQIRIQFTPGDPEALALDHAARRFAAAFARDVDGEGLERSDALRAAVLEECRTASGGRDSRAERAMAIGAGIGVFRCDGRYRLCDSHGWIDSAQDPGSPISAEIIDVVGARTILRSQQELRFAASNTNSRGRGVDIEAPERPLEAPPLGLRAQRLIRVEFAMEGRRMAFAALAETRRSALPARVWRVIGPFGWAWDRSIAQQVYSPEASGGQGLGRRDWHDARNGSWLTWSPAAAGEKWPVDFQQSNGRDQGASGLGYAVTSVLSSQRQRARLVIDSSDKLECWLNGVKVYSQDGFETEAALQGGAWVTLPQGRSTLLVKCASGGGGWGFSLAIDGEREVAAEPEVVRDQREVGESGEAAGAPPSFG